MKLLFASDSFKGSLDSRRTIELLDEAAHRVFPDCTTDGVPVADGGEGTVEAVIAAEGGTLLPAKVTGPLGDAVTAAYGGLPDGRAIIEMASASGLTLVPEALRDPLNTSSRGTGELILDALDRGYRDISVAIGGSATNDGGLGCLRALGARPLDAEGRCLEGRGRDLARLDRVDLTGLDPRLKAARFTVMCDVTNPLCGDNGATRTFGPQKGGTPEALDALEAGMRRYRDIILRDFGADCDAMPGAGAAGGLGAALMVFLGAERRSGIETVLDLIRFDERLRDVDLVVTGEGRTDWQSCFGKVMQGVGERAARHGIPVVGLSGSLGDGAAGIFDHGVQSLMTTVNAPMGLDEAMDRAEALYLQAAERMFRFIRVGMGLGKDAVKTFKTND